MVLGSLSRINPLRNSMILMLCSCCILFRTQKIPGLAFLPIIDQSNNFQKHLLINIKWWFYQKGRMIFQKSTSISIKLKRHQYVVFLSPAYNDSFAMIYSNYEPDEEDCRYAKTEKFKFQYLKEDAKRLLSHYNSEGKLMWKRPVCNNVKKFSMLNDREIIVNNSLRNCIDLLCLVTYKIKSISYLFPLKDSKLSTVESFYESGLFCLHQRYEQMEKLRITYYDSKELTNDHKPIFQWRSKNGQCNRNHIVRKANNHSKICWIDSKILDHSTISFSFMELNSNFKGQLQTIIVVNTLAEGLGCLNGSISIRGVEQAAKNQYFLHVEPKSHEGLINEKQESKLIDKVTSFKDNTLDCFVIDSSLGNNQATVRSITTRAKYQYCHKLAMAQCFENGLFCKLNQFQYASSHCEEIVQKPFSSTCDESYFVSGWDPWTVGKYSREKINWSRFDMKKNKAYKDDMIVVIKKFTELKMHYLHSLLHINPQFDDDLLQDAIDLLS